MTTQQLIGSFYGALGSQDWEGLRALLANDLRFEGPIDTFDRPEPLIEALQKLSQLTSGATMHKLFVDGDEACAVYDLHSDTPIGTSQVAEYFTVADGRIAKIRVHFDARPWAALFAAHA